MADNQPARRRTRYYSFDFRGFVARWLFATFLVFGLYNPSGASLFHWLRDDFAAYWMLLLPAAGLAAIFYFLTVRATVLYLRIVGMSLVTALLGSAVWVLSDLGAVDLGNRAELELAILLVFSSLLAAGISGMHVETRVTGMVNVDDLTIDPAP
ncbi:MAG: DUF6524 family protein [Alphaproteobacteria bacterium]